MRLSFRSVFNRQKSRCLSCAAFLHLKSAQVLESTWTGFSLLKSSAGVPTLEVKQWAVDQPAVRWVSRGTWAKTRAIHMSLAPPHCHHVNHQGHIEVKTPGCTLKLVTPLDQHSPLTCWGCLLLPLLLLLLWVKHIRLTSITLGLVVMRREQRRAND